MENSNNDFKQITAEKNEETQDSSNPPFFLPEEVKKSYTNPIRERFDTLLRERGKKWSEVYSKLGLWKSYASLVRNGKTIPPLFMRVKIATALQVDSSVIWDSELKEKRAPE